ncbi:MAG: hypothetical protein KY464_03155 [Gemmatimonadetes bacterium]|nr:hypothetical protein [Gemmatimonadota bacterium]
MADLTDVDLWLLYVDWSATQINKRLLELSVHDLWALANEPAGPDSAEVPTVPADLLPAQGSTVELLQLVRRATLSIARELNLPSFAVWKQAYARDSAAFAPDITRI